MFEFMTIRELYELFSANNMMEIDGLEYVQLQDGLKQTVTMGR